jgi:hypothetical protein
MWSGSDASGAEKKVVRRPLQFEIIHHLNGVLTYL